MKLKRAKLIIRPINDIKKEWKEALKGNKKSIPAKDEIIFTSYEDLSKVFSKTRIEILNVIITKRPQSIYELAKMIERDFKNVHSDVNLLANIGLIELKEAGDPRNGLIPVPKFSGIQIDLAA